MKHNETQMRDMHLTMPDRLMRQLDRMASEKFLSRASLIRQILLKHVEEHSNV